MTGDNGDKFDGDKLHASADEWVREAQLAGGTGTFRLDLGSNRWEWTPQITVLFGLGPDGAGAEFKDWESTIFADDVPKVRAALKTAMTSGSFYVELRVRHPDQSVHWLAGKGQTRADRGAKARWLFGSYFEITDRKVLDARLLALNETLEARVAEVRQEAGALEIINRTGVVLAAELDLERLVQTVTDAGVELVGAQFGAFFYNTVNEQGETYTLYTLSGAPREAFAKFPQPRNTAIFGPTFRGEGTVRSDDILADPRYGKNPPYNGMPQGHLPVRSYLAVPVVSRSGEVLGGLFFGHANPGMFSARSERVMSVVAAQAAVAIDNARLHQTGQRQIEALARAERALQELNGRLEERAEERARQLEARSEQLREIEDRFRLVVEAATDYAIFMLDPRGNVASWNPGAQRVKGYTAQEIIGEHFSRFYIEADRRDGRPEKVLAAAAQNGKYEIEGWRVRKDGTTFWASVVVAAIRDPAGELLGFAKITRDLTERRNADEQLRQAQKMEAIGQLTGGVAHDFNNLLTVISGNVETILRRLPDEAADLKRPANAALHGAMRAAVLTQRLLAFARRQALEPKSLSINELVTGMSEMLRRTLGENIVVETVLGAGLWSAFVDANQLENSILNLAINARDAMPDGGKLTIETGNVYFDDDYAAAADVPAGQYVGLFVSDTGIGMTAETMSKAFDPFFTTKEIGQGTGLGLSQVYGFIRQSGGHVKVYSEVGSGTTLKLYLPRHHSTAGMTENQTVTAPIPRANEETILVAEDDPDVRNFTVEMLHELDYRVIEAPDGQTALRLLDANRDIVLLFTDVGLPGGMNGRQLADEAKRRRPDLKVLFTSGYARNAIVHHGRLDPGVELLVKPFTFAGLAAKIRRVLDER
ncbi:MAG TPA: PAS domain S-box protein [Stellaceae bacterium]|jgi:PAS domain S-box-containing protein|nr:PAS domain S-box protein [Stellaceae bacterium]